MLPWYLGQRVRVLAKVRVMRGGIESFATWRVPGLSIAAVRYNGNVRDRETRARWLSRDERNMPVEGVLVGRTYRQIGLLNWEPMNESGMPPYVEDPISVTVYLVATGLRWRTPLQVLEADLEALV